MSQTPEKQTTAETVFDAIKEMHQNGQRCDRHTLAEATGFPLSVVDDRLKVLRDDLDVLRHTSGHHEPVITFPKARPISASMVDGWFKVEVGDSELMLTPAERRVFFLMVAPPAQHSPPLELLESARHTMEASAAMHKQVSEFKALAVKLAAEQSAIRKVINRSFRQKPKAGQAPSGDVVQQAVAEAAKDGA